MQKNALRVIWVRREFALGIFLLTMLLGATVLSFNSVRYTATATLSFQPQEYKVQSKDDILRPPPSAQRILETFRTTATTNEFLWPLVESHNFKQRAAFNPALHPDNTFLAKWREQWKKPDEPFEGTTPEQRLKQSIAEKIKRDLHITLSPDMTVKITFTSPTPDVAAKVANAVMDKLVLMPQPEGRKKILIRAQTPTSFSEPLILRTLTVTGLLGTVIGICLAYILGHIQRRKTGSGASCMAI